MTCLYCHKPLIEPREIGAGCHEECYDEHHNNTDENYPESEDDDAD